MEFVMITLQPITEDNVFDVLELRASEELVAPNSESLAEAYCSLQEVMNGELPSKYALMPFAITLGETIVGFTMIGLEDGEDVSADGEIYWMSRFMIDEQHQGKGYGKAAMVLLVNLVKAWPHGHEVRYFYTSVVPHGHIATKTYAGVGFEKTGQELGGEDVMRMILE